MSGLVVVTDACSAVCGSVAHALISSRLYRVRGVTRDTDTAAARSLKAQGVELVNADWWDASALDAALSGATACFLHTTTDLACPEGYTNETEEGKAVVDACRRQRVSHVVCCTQVHVRGATGLTARHMDAKAEVFEHARGLAVTGLILPHLYEDLLHHPLKPLPDAHGVFCLGIPMGLTSLGMMAVGDVGPLVLEILVGGGYIGKTVSPAGDKLTVSEMAAILASELRCHFRDRQLTTAEFRQLHADTPGIGDLTNQFEFYLRVNQRCSVDTSRRMYPGLQAFPHWVADNARAILQALGDPRPSIQDREHPFLHA